ncbi:MAG: hotdog fold thioesterase [Deltaproteobacteria bacterium]|jgi:acyl-CoA thioesterase|nr:hotdog fold thioesterase [Deltaproteobacteria bacterium]
MDQKVREAIFEAVKKEPFARALQMELMDLADGYSVVQMIYEPEKMDNIYARAHGGAIYALIDEAFETAGQTDGTIAVALNVNVTYVSSPEPGLRLQAEARRVSQTRKTASYDIKVTDQNGQITALCQALAFRTGKPIPFL